MARTQAGQIYVSVSARTDKYRDDIQRARAEVENLGRSAKSSNSQIVQSTDGASHSAKNFFTVAAEGATTTALAHRQLTAELTKLALSTATGSSRTDTLAAAYRALRIALSPTPFTVAGLAVGYLTEQIFKLTNARAVLIEQQALFAATTNIPVRHVEQLDNLSEISGSKNIRGLFGDLSDRSTTHRGTVESGLTTLGIDPAGLDKLDPTMLGKIAAGFASIEDPAKRAAAAVALFGADKAGEALQQLSPEFVNAAQAAERYGVVLDSVSRQQIYNFRRELLQLKSALFDLSSTETIWESLKTVAEATLAGIVDLSDRATHSINTFIDRFAVVQTLRGAIAGGVDAVPSISGTIDKRNSLQNRLTSDDLLAQAEAARARQVTPIEGLRATLSDAKSRADDTFKKLKAPNSGLSDDQRFQLATQLQADTQLQVSTKERIQALEEREAADKKAAAAAEEAAKRIEAANKRFADSFTNRISELKARLEESQTNLSTAGLDESSQAVAKGYGEAVKAIAALEKQQDGVQRRLTDAQRGQISTLAIQTAKTEAETAWQRKLSQSTDQIEEQTRAQNLLADAVGKTFEAIRANDIEARLAQAVGPGKLNDTKFVKDHSSDLDELRAKLGGQYDAERGRQTAETIAQLTRQTELEQSIAAAQSKGAESVQRATLEGRLLEIGRTNGADATRKLTAAELALYEAQRSNRSAATVAGIEQETEAVRRLTAALTGGAAASRQAQLENELAKAARDSGTGDGADRERAALITLEQARHEQEITQQVQARLNLGRDELANLNEQEATIQGIVRQQGESVATSIALRDIERDRLRIAAQQALANGTLRDGLRAFLLDAQANAKKPGEILYEGLQSGLDRFSDSLANVLTGKSGNWAKMFDDIGHQILSGTVKSAISAALGGLTKQGPGGQGSGNPIVDALKGVFGGGAAGGGIFNLKGKAGDIAGKAGEIAAGIGPNALSGLGLKPDGTRGNPFYVVAVMAAQPKAPPQEQAAKPGFWGTLLGSLLGSLTGVAVGALTGGSKAGGVSSSSVAPAAPIESVTSSISFDGFRANGGPVNPRSAYVVGERGKEVFVPDQAGRVYSNADSEKLSGGGPTHTYNVSIDARGTDPALVEQRVQKAIIAAHNSAVSTSVQAQIEFKRRTVKGA